MFVSGKCLVTISILLALGQTIHADYNATEYCALVKTGTKLGSIDSCQKYYVCKDNVAVEQSCSSSESFDKNAQTCKPSANVECYYGLANVCVDKNLQYVPEVGTCGGWIWCKNGAVAGKGSCGAGMIFEDGECQYDLDNCTPGSGDPEVDLQSVCQIMPNNLYFGSSLDCTTWQMCYGKDQLNSGECPSPLVFDIVTGYCSYKAAGMCDRVTGESTQPEDTSCVSNTDTVKADPAKCSVYLTCTNNKWVPTSCPAGQYWDVEKKGCVVRILATPVATCDRCEYSKQTFVNAVDNTCRSYYVCKDGVKQGAGGQCQTGYYLNEGAQTCSADETLKQYSEANGACAGYGNGGSVTPDDGSVTPDDGSVTPDDGSVTPDDGSVTPDDGSVTPDDGSVTPDDGSVTPDDGSVTPDDGSVTPDDGSVTPDDGSVTPDDGSVTPDDGSVTPDDGSVTPEEGDA